MFFRGSTSEITTFYGKTNLASVLSTDVFKSWVYDSLLPELSGQQKSHILNTDLTMKDITEAIAHYYGTSEQALWTGS